MKKILCLFICFSLCVCFALPAFASQTIINGKNYINLSNYNYVESGFSQHTIQEYVDSARSLSSMSKYPYYFAYPYGVNSNGTGKVLVICSSVPKLVFDVDTRTLHTPSNSSEDFGVIWTYNVGSTSSGDETVPGFYVPDDFPLDKLYEYSNMTFENVSRPFNPENPPDVFTYSVDKNNFSLLNGEQGRFNVTISYTQEYIDYVNNIREFLDPDFNGTYSFICYVSKTRAVDLDSLISSLNDMSYVKLTYNDYYTSDGWQGFSDYTINRGADLSFSLNPLQQQSITIPCLSENIQGTTEHTDGFITVLGAYTDAMETPTAFSASWFSDSLSSLYTSQTTLSLSAVNGLTSPNDRYLRRQLSENGVSGLVPAYNLHQYYIPYDIVGTYKCDLFSGTYTYKNQTVNGKDYAPVTSSSDNPTPEFQQHSQMKDKNTWLTPDAYKKYYNDWLKKNQYNEDFDFNGQTFKEVFDKEGDFFNFIGSALSVFPSYIMSIFVAFLVCMLVIVLLKFIL